MTTITSSSDSGVTLGKSKAYASGVAATLVAFLGALSVAYADGAVSGQEWINIALTTVVAAAAGFGVTYATPTSVKFS